MANTEGQTNFKLTPSQQIAYYKITGTILSQRATARC